MNHEHVLTISIVFLQILKCLAGPDELYQKCASRFTCGNSTDVGFPFWGNARPSNCGIPALNLVCDYYQSQTNIQISNLMYSVISINSTRQTMKIARQDVQVQDECIATPRDTAIDSTLFDYSPGYDNITFIYGCSSPPATSSMFNLASPCYLEGFSYTEVYAVAGSRRRGSCNVSVTMPVVSSAVKQMGSLRRLMESVGDGFEIQWKAETDACTKCTNSSGQCGYNASAADPFVCYCLQPPYVGKTCSSPAAESTKAKRALAAESTKAKRALAAGIAIGAAIIAILALAGFAYFVIKRRKSNQNKSVISASSRPDHHRRRHEHHLAHLQKFQAYPFKKFEVDKGSTYFGVQLFSYAELEEATDNFDPSHELGDGGFGVVYYGELFDGRQVAVKRLYERNFKSIEQFMNEVEILARLRHPNLVTLYGCTSRCSRELLLVYEYVSNGTLADHLHGRRSASTFLNWPLRLNIALETASALAYLHACDIIHRDVKTNNILLDNKFSVKVVDFGLSRLFPNDVTHVSTAPQGTPGYVDPEYYNCYQLTDKSDVYSFGVVLAELVSSKEAVDITRHRHDINLSSMAVRKIQDCLLHELVDPRLAFECDDAVKKEVTLVSELAFRCLQQDTEVRPSMDDVVDALREIAGVAGKDDGEDDKRRWKEEFFSTSPVSVGTKWISGSTTSNSNA